MMDRKHFNGMTSEQRGEELWAMAGDSNIAEMVADYGGTAEAASAAIEVLSDDPEADELFELVPDAETDIQRYLESQL